MSDDIFDFGFTAVDETELESVQKATTQLDQVVAGAETTQEKLDKLYNAIIPLLNKYDYLRNLGAVTLPFDLACLAAFSFAFFC